MLDTQGDGDCTGGGYKGQDYTGGHALVVDTKGEGECIGSGYKGGGGMHWWGYKALGMH